jgi:alanyl-tRNA synthetase
LKDVDRIVSGAYEQIKALQQSNADLKNQINALKSNEWIKEAKPVGDLLVLAKNAGEMDGAALKDIAGKLKNAHPNLVVLLAGEKDGKVFFAAGAGADAVKAGAHAGKLVKEAAAVCGGKGGGKPDLAQAGGKDASKIEEALKAVSFPAV